MLSPTLELLSTWSRMLDALPYRQLRGRSPARLYRILPTVFPKPTNLKYSIIAPHPLRNTGVPTSSFSPHSLPHPPTPRKEPPSPQTGSDSCRASSPRPPLLRTPYPLGRHLHPRKVPYCTYLRCRSPFFLGLEGRLKEAVGAQDSQPTFRPPRRRHVSSKSGRTRF
ncbi:hypothetical protein BDQ17DRAFT_521913 [Cyathus striatus]|nr:hypothetical protein BDQ17DRAFT_521913 [Cyathus striatus]